MPMTSVKSKDVPTFDDIFVGYYDKEIFLALNRDRSKVITTGGTPQKAHANARKKGYKYPIIMRAPSSGNFGFILLIQQQLASYKSSLRTFPHNRSNAFPKSYNSRWGYIPVTLAYANAVAQRIDTVIDTGALWTIYSRSIADSLGIILTTGKLEKVGGVGGISDVWFHKLRLTFGRWSYQCKVGFLDYDLEVNGVLGYVGLFDRFRYTIDVENHNFTLERLPKIYK